MLNTQNQIKSTDQIYKFKKKPLLLCLVAVKKTFECDDQISKTFHLP